MDLNFWSLIAGILGGIAIVFSVITWLYKRIEKLLIKIREISYEKSVSFNFDINTRNKEPINLQELKLIAPKLLFLAKKGDQLKFKFNIDNILIVQKNINKLARKKNLSENEKSNLLIHQNYFNRLITISDTLEKGFTIIHNSAVAELLCSFYNNYEWHKLLYEFILVVVNLLNQLERRVFIDSNRIKLDVFSSKDNKKYFGIYLIDQEMEQLLLKLDLTRPQQLMGNLGYDIHDLGRTLLSKYVVPKMIFEYVVNQRGNDSIEFLKYSENLLTWKIGLA